MLRSEFAYDLPDELIARYPCERRCDSRLLHLDGNAGTIVDRNFTDLPALLRKGDLLVFNDTRVLPARLHGVKDSGGRIELLLERVVDTHRVLAQLRASKPPRPGSGLMLAGKHRAIVVGRRDEFWEVRFADEALAVFERHGEMPLPPYLHRAAEAIDRERYQTVYARVPGAVAAPTAGLHFDAALLDCCAAAGISAAHLTLHVGAGTFQPVRVDDLDAHHMHAEVMQRFGGRSALRSRRHGVTADGSSRSARPACARSSPPPLAVSWRRMRARRDSSSGPVIAFAWSTPC